MIDTHTHIYLKEEFEGDNEAVLARAVEAGVSAMVFPNVDESTMEPMLELHRRHPGRTYIAAGLHPTEVRENWREAMARTLTLLDEPGCVAVGEVGIDLYWDATFRASQMEAFEAQLRVARERSLPAIVHCREGLDEVLEVCRRLGEDLPVLIFHSFTGTPEDVARIRTVADAWFGINGVVTFKNAKELRESLPEIGLGRILLETDSPYLSPAPYRGKRNESARLPLICGQIADTLGVTPAEVEAATDANARRVFGLPE